MALQVVARRHSQWPAVTLKPHSLRHFKSNAAFSLITCPILPVAQASVTLHIASRFSPFDQQTLFLKLAPIVQHESRVVSSLQLKWNAFSGCGLTFILECLHSLSPEHLGNATSRTLNGELTSAPDTITSSNSSLSETLVLESLVCSCGLLMTPTPSLTSQLLALTSYV